MANRITLSDGSSWPRPFLESDDQVGAGSDSGAHAGRATREDQLVLAGIAAAYSELVMTASRRRDFVCREIQETATDYTMRHTTGVFSSV